MKVRLIKDLSMGSRTRPEGLIMDVDRELGNMLIEAGNAVAAEEPVEKKKKRKV